MKKKTNKILCTTLDQILVVLVFLVYAIMLPAKASSQDSQFGKAPVSASHMSASRMSLSFSLQEWGNEFGTGFQITSPWFWHEKTAVRLGGSALWKQDANWATFYALRLGLWGRLSWEMRIFDSMEKADSCFSFLPHPSIAILLLLAAMDILALSFSCRRPSLLFRLLILSSLVRMA